MNKLCSLVLIGSITSLPAAAQPMVQSDFYEGGIRDRGDRIIFCIWPSSPMVALDRAVGEQIAGLQLLEAEFFEVPLLSSGTQEVFEQELFIHLMDDCDALMGTSLTWRPLPEWLTVTQAYYEVSYLLASNTASQGDVRNLPAGSKVGSLMLTQADMTFSRVMSAAGGGEIARIPYNTSETILRAIGGGQLDAGIVPSHALPLLQGQFGGGEIEIAPLAFPPIEPEPVGIAMLSRDTYLRELLDQSIATLEGDGTLAQIIVELGYAVENNDLN